MPDHDIVSSGQAAGVAATYRQGFDGDRLDFASHFFLTGTQQHFRLLIGLLPPVTRIPAGK